MKRLISEERLKNILKIIPNHDNKLINSFLNKKKKSDYPKWNGQKLYNKKMSLSLNDILFSKNFISELSKFTIDRTTYLNKEWIKEPVTIELGHDGKTNILAFSYNSYNPINVNFTKRADSHIVLTLESIKSIQNMLDYWSFGEKNEGIYNLNTNDMYDISNISFGTYTYTNFLTKQNMLLSHKEIEYGKKTLDEHLKEILISDNHFNCFEEYIKFHERLYKIIHIKETIPYSGYKKYINNL
jgi:hypothetical protein